MVQTRRGGRWRVIKMEKLSLAIKRAMLKSDIMFWLTISFGIILFSVIVTTIVYVLQFYPWGWAVLAILVLIYWVYNIFLSYKEIN